MLQACVCKEVSWTPDGSETAANRHLLFQSTIFPPHTPVILFLPLPLSHLLWGLAMTISVTSVETLEKVGPRWEIA